MKLEKEQRGPGAFPLESVSPLPPPLSAGGPDPGKVQPGVLAPHTLKRELRPHKQKVEVGC